MIRKLIKVSAVTLLLALPIIFSFSQKVSADAGGAGEVQRAGTGAKIPGLDAIKQALPDSGSTPGINGTSPIQDNDVFTRANGSGDLSFMKTMWGLTRKLTNVMVVVFLFIAAAATTLNFQVSTYSIKKTLPSVLLATLYANFSYAIAQLFNSVNMAFLNAFTDSTTSVMALMSHFIKGPLDNQYSKISLDNNWGGNMMALLVLAIMAVLAVGLLVLVLLFVVRNYFLAMLIAIAPLAFMSLAMPFTQSAFKKWWDQFIKWMFFPAIAGFWLYMGGVALTAAGISGGLIGIVMAGLILWVAIRTPFTIGAGVGAVAGFITGNAATRAAGGAIGRSARDYGVIAANRTPGLGNIIRGWRFAGQLREARVKEAMSGPVVASRRRSRITAADSTLLKVRKYFGNMRASVNGRVNGYFHGGIGAANAAATIGAGEVGELEQRGELAYRSRRGVQARVGALAIATENLQRNLANLSSEARTSVLNTNRLLQAERELSRQREEMATRGKTEIEARLARQGQDPNSALHQDIRQMIGTGTMRDRVMRALTGGRHLTEMQRVLQSYGFNYNPNDPTSLTRVYGQQGFQAQAAQGALESQVTQQQYDAARRNMVMVNMMQNVSGHANYNGGTTAGVQNVMTDMMAQAGANGTEEQLVEFNNHLVDQLALAGLDGTRITAADVANGRARDILTNNYGMMTGTAEYSLTANALGSRVQNDVGLRQRVEQVVATNDAFANRTRAAVGQNDSTRATIQKDFFTANQRMNDLTRRMGGATDVERQANLDHVMSQYLQGNTQYGHFVNPTTGTSAVRAEGWDGHIDMVSRVRQALTATYNGLSNIYNDTFMEDAEELSNRLGQNPVLQPVANTALQQIGNIQNMIANVRPQRDIDAEKNRLAQILKTQQVRDAIGYLGETNKQALNP